MKYIALICARGGSKGVPGKNIRKLAGRPLISWSIQVARQVKRISRVIVSTDSKEIAKVAEASGAEVPFLRPAKLAQDDSAEWLVWRHALDYLDKQNEQFDGLVSLPPTAPLRNLEDVDNCIDEFEKGGADSIITVSTSYRSPYFNMIKIDEDGFSSLVIPPEKTIIRRQDTPLTYDMTTVAYVSNPKFVRKHNGIFEGKIRSVLVPPERALDIDTLLDFKMAEWFVRNNQE